MCIRDRPIMPGTFSVPARLPRSWAPPSMMLVRGMPWRAYSTPVPLGPVSYTHLDVYKRQVMEAAEAAVKAAEGTKTVPMHTFSGPVEHAIAHIDVYKRQG